MKDRSKRVFLRYMKLLLKYKKILIISFILIMINSVLTIILPEVMMRIIDDALPQKDMKLLITLVEAFLMVVILQTVFKFIQDFICSKLGKKVLYDIKNKLINHLFKLDGDYYSNVKVGELLTIIDSDVYTIEQISTNVIFSIISDNVTAVVILIYLIKLQPNLAGIVVILQIVLLVFQLKSSKKLIDNRKEFRDVYKRQDINHDLTTLFRKPHALVTSSAFNQLEEKLKNLYEKYFFGKDKEFIRLLDLIGKVGIEKVEKSISIVSNSTPTSVTLDKIEFICQRNNDMEFYKQYFKDKDSEIINNSLHMLSDYADLLSERKGDIS